MKKLFLLAGATLVFTTFAPMASNAQSVGIETPGVGVHVGERPYYREHRSFDEPRLRERRFYHERDVGLRGGCKTVTIHRDDGSMKRIRAATSVRDVLLHATSGRAPSPATSRSDMTTS